MTSVTQYSATSQSPQRALHFALTTSPDTVRVSPNTTNPELADFILVGTRRGYPIQIDKITVTIRTGTGSHQLALDLNGVDPSSSLDWTPEIGTQTITFTPATQEYAEIAPDKGVTIQLMRVRINAEIGSSALDVTVRFREADSPDPDSWFTDTTTFDVGKFPPDFYVRNFIPDKLSIESGEGVTLSWEVGGATRVHLLYEAAEVNVLNYVKWPPGEEKITLRNTTVFYLRAGIQAGTSLVERILSATVTVIRPDLEIGSLIVHGDTVIHGDTLISPGNKLITDTLAAATTEQKCLHMHGNTAGSPIIGTRYSGWTAQSFEIVPTSTGSTAVAIRAYYPRGGPYLYLTMDTNGQVTARQLGWLLIQAFVILDQADGSQVIQGVATSRVLSMTPEGVVTNAQQSDGFTLDQKFNIVGQADGSKGIREWRTAFARQITTPGLNVNGRITATAFDVRTADAGAGE
jgi:hypothetical protein